MGETGDRGRAPDGRIGEEEVRQVDIRVRPVGDVDHDRIDVLPDLGVHRGVVDDGQVDRDPDLSQLGLQHLVVTAICRHLGGDQVDLEAVAHAGLFHQLASHVQVLVVGDVRRLSFFLGQTAGHERLRHD